MNAPLYQQETYFDQVMSRPVGTVTEIALKLEEFRVDGELPFDTLVGTGASGLIALLPFATELKVNAAFVRKDNDRSHCSSRLVGRVGQRWALLDDFIDFGDTARRVREAVASRVPEAAFAGALLYCRMHDGPWYPPERIRQTFNKHAANAVLGVPADAGRQKDMKSLVLLGEDR